VHSGRTFVGSIGVEDGNYQFAALGDPMNFCARLVASAKAGEMIVSEAVWQDVSDSLTADQCSLQLKGYAEPVKAYVTQVAPA
jgi:adenylate cyclase